MIDVDTSFIERVQIGSKAGHVIAGITGAFVCGVVGKIVAKKLVDTALKSCTKIALSAAAGAIAGGIAGLAVDIIVGSITGAVERDKLKDAIEKLEININSFVPASQDYTANIYMVLAEAKVYLKYHPSD